MDKKQPHRVFQINKKLIALQGYMEDGHKLCYHFGTNNDSFISSVEPQTDSKNIRIDIIYAGKASDASEELLDKLLVSSDTSYNPSRPFRWYHFTEGDCAMTDDPLSIKRVRDLSFSNLLKKIDTPEYIWIYEIVFLNLPKQSSND